jgi:DNA-binding transcriptional LysR family regulator
VRIVLSDNPGFGAHRKRKLQISAITIGDDVELRQLAAFVAVAEEMSITKAARRLNVVQSAVSATVRTLERQLGVALLSRSSRGVELTDAGRLFLPEARHTLASADQAHQVLEQLRGGLRGTLRLGIMLFDAAVDLSLPQLISRFGLEYPGVEIKMHTGTSVEHAEALRRDHLDVAYLALPPESAAGLRLLPIYEEVMSLAVPTGHRLATRGQVPLDEAAREPFVETGPTWGSRIFNDLAFVHAASTRTIRYQIADHRAVLEFVRHGLGVAISPRLSPEPSMVFVPIAHHAPRLTISLASADRELSTPARELLRIARHLTETGRHQTQRTDPPDRQPDAKPTAA